MTSTELDALVALGEGITGEPVTLAECPIGLFLHGKTLCLKTEYGNNEGRIDAYIVESGEFYWGDHPQTIANQRRQMVKPIETDLIAAIITLRKSEDELREALGIIAGGDVDVSDTAIIVGDGASTVMRQVRAALSNTEGGV